MSSFRGGPVFPAMFIGATGCVAMLHLPGLPLVPAVAMGMGAMIVTVLRLPRLSVLVATLLLASDELAVAPLVIVAVVIAYVVTTRISPPLTRPRPRNPRQPRAQADRARHVSQPGKQLTITRRF